MIRVFWRYQSSDPQSTVPYTRRWNSGLESVSSRVPDSERWTRPTSFVAPERPGDPIDGPQDLFCLPLAALEEIIEIPGRLVQIENQGVGHIGHRCSPC